MKNKTQKILTLLEKYNAVVKEARENKYITTNNFVGNIIETLVCHEINAVQSVNSQKGFDAVRDEERIQIKFRSQNKSGKYKVTFKNITEKDLGFDTLAFCCQTDKGYNIYEIKVNDFPNTKFKHGKNQRILILDDDLLENNSIKKYIII